MKKTLFELFSKQRKSLWFANAVTIGLLILFVLVIFALEWLAKPAFTPTTLVLSGIIMAVLPSILWLGFFYRQDQLEPEPKGMVWQVFLLGCLLAVAIGIPLVDQIFQPARWLFKSDWVNILGAILVVGFSQEFLKYLSVRFTVYNTAEFDQRIDGVIYATSAGLGFATVLNMHYFISTGGVNLGMGAIRVVVTALAQASFAGITGYFMGKEKLDKAAPWYVPLGLCIAALLNGLFYYFRGILSRPTISASSAMNPWVGFILSVVIAMAVAGALSWLIDRDQSKTFKSQEA